MNRNVKCILIGWLLMLSGSAIWGQGFAWTASNYSGALLYGNNLTPVVHLDALTGNFLVQAKASVTNIDGDPQYANCQLDVKSASQPNSPITLDTTYVRLDSANGGDKGTVALQGKFCGGYGEIDYTVEMSCATYQGGAQDAVLTAVSVGGLDGCDSFPTRAWVKPLPEAVTNQNWADVNLGGIDHPLPGGNYTVSGKVAIFSNDSSAQDGSCKLVAIDENNLNAPIVLDITHIRVGRNFAPVPSGEGPDEQAVTLQGTYCTAPAHDPVIFQLECATYFGFFNYPVLTVTEASTLACALPPM